MFGEYIVESFLIPDIEIDAIWSLTADELYAVNDLFGRVIEIVCDDYFVACFEEGKGGEGANVAGASE